MDYLRFGVIVGQGAGERPHRVVAPIVVRLDRLDIDLQHLAGLGAADGDGAGEDVRTEPRRKLVLNRRERRRNRQRRRRHQFSWPRHRRDHDALAAVDGQPRRQLGIEIAPVHGLGRRLEAMGVLAAMDVHGLARWRRERAVRPALARYGTVRKPNPSRSRSKRLANLPASTAQAASTSFARSTFSRRSRRRSSVTSASSFCTRSASAATSCGTGVPDVADARATSVNATPTSMPWRHRVVTRSVWFFCGM